MPPYEKTIRDNLARHLDVLEPGLQLIATEHSLPNAHGSKGFIDILAKDAFGNRVVIELKRSNQSARQALHEIFKYSALFRSREGLPYGKIRCFVVSTEWHELRVPFAEFIRVADFQCEGFELSVDEEGNILEATKHEPVELPEPLNLFCLHSAFLFQKATARNEAVKAIVDAFKTTGGLGCFVVILEYEGQKSSVIYGHAAYLVAAAVAKDVVAELEKEAREEVGYLDDEADEIRSSVEDRFLMRLVETAGNISDTFEIGYPEKFHTLLLTGWKVERIVRWGQVPTTAAAVDDEIARMITGTEGQSAVHFHQLTSPKFEIQWNEVRNNAKHCLLGNEAWTRGFDWFCDLIESSSPAANVSFSIFNPLNLPMAFFQLLARDDPRYLPSFQIVAVDQQKKSLTSLLGRIEWNVATRPGSLDNVFTPDFCDLETFFFAEVVKDHWHFDAGLMKRHGLYYALARADEDARGFETSHILVEDQAGFLNCRTMTESGKTIGRFIEENEAYLHELIDWIGNHYSGL